MCDLFRVMFHVSFSSLPTCYRFSHRANFQRATYPSLPPTFSTGSPASHHTSWLSSPLCNLHCWELSHGRMFSLMSLRKPEEYEKLFFFSSFFPWTQMGKCVGYTWSTVFAFFFSFPCQSFFFFATPVWYFCPSQKNSGMDQTRISLIWPFLCCISIYWSFILMFGDALKKKKNKKNQDVWTRTSDYLDGLFTFICLFIDCHIHFFTREDHKSCCTAMARKTFQHVIFELCTDILLKAFFIGGRINL